MKKIKKVKVPKVSAKNTPGWQRFVKTKKKAKGSGLEQRVKDLEARMTAAEAALNWQPAQPPGHEPAPLVEPAPPEKDAPSVAA